MPSTSKHQCLSGIAHPLHSSHVLVSLLVVFGGFHYQLTDTLDREGWTVQVCVCVCVCVLKG